MLPRTTLPVDDNRTARVAGIHRNRDKKRLIFVLTLFGAIGLLVLAAWPGLVEKAVFGFPLVFIALPLLGVWFLMLVVLGVRDIAPKSDPTKPRSYWGLAAACIMFCTIGLLWLHVPQRIAFAFCYKDLLEIVDRAPAVPVEEEIHYQVGPYKLDRWGADPRGGVFFRTGTGADGIGPDQMSYGFALRPHGQGTPFGNAHYRQRRLFGDWYVFAVSNDW